MLILIVRREKKNCRYLLCNTEIKLWVPVYKSVEKSPDCGSKFVYGGYNFGSGKKKVRIRVALKFNFSQIISQQLVANEKCI